MHLFCLNFKLFRNLAPFLEITFWDENTIFCLIKTVSRSHNDLSVIIFKHDFEHERCLLFSYENTVLAVFFLQKLTRPISNLYPHLNLPLFLYKSAPVHFVFTKTTNVRFFLEITFCQNVSYLKKSRQ